MNQTHEYLFALCGLLILSTGCAVRYSDRGHNKEQLWGVGTLKIKVQKLDEHYVVARYTCVPGVCIEVGRQRFGINLGGLVEEQSTILDADNPNPVDAQIQCRIIRPWGESESAWNFGWQQTYLIQKYQNKLASSEGTASWGVNLGVGGLSSNFSMGYSSKQRTLLFAGDGHLSIDQDAQNWKGFNLYNASVAGDFAGLSFKTQTSKNENN